MVKAEDSQLSGCGFKSRHRILDGCQRCLLLQLKIMKVKVAKWGTPKKEVYFNRRFEMHDISIDAHREGKGGRGVYETAPPQANF